MSEPPIEQEIIERVKKLSASQQRQVLSFVRTLAGELPLGVPGKELLQFVGILSHEEAEELRAAIEEDCERVDLDEW